MFHCLQITNEILSSFGWYCKVSGETGKFNSCGVSLFQLVSGGVHCTFSRPPFQIPVIIWWWRQDPLLRWRWDPLRRWRRWAWSARCWSATSRPQPSTSRSMLPWSAISRYWDLIHFLKSWKKLINSNSVAHETHPRGGGGRRRRLLLPNEKDRRSQNFASLQV